MDGAGDKQVSHVTDCVSVIASFPDLLLLAGEGGGGRGEGEGGGEDVM